MGPLGRHTEEIDVSRIGSTGMGTGARLGLVAAGVVTVVGIGVLVAPRDAFSRLPWAAASCSKQKVDVVVAPEVEPVVRDLLTPPDGADGDLACISPTIRAQEPDETVASAQILPADRAPQVWIPDASSWEVSTSENWRTTSHGSLATSPVVIASSRATAAKLGWDERNPTWEQAMRGRTPVAVPDYRQQAESLESLIALWTTMGGEKKADSAVVATVLGADRSDIPSPETAMANARSGSSNAALIPTTEQNVALQNAQANRPNVIATYPRQGSPRLDFPILTVDGSITTDAMKDAVGVITERLKSADAQDVVSRAGFRNASGARPTGDGIRSDYTLELKRPQKAEIDSMLGRLDQLSKPTRILAVLDVSTSMTAKLNDGLTRMQLTGAAARLGANLLPDSGQVGAWVFASNMKGGKDYRELAPVRRLGSRADNGEDWRSYLIGLASDVDQYLTPGGTSLYDVTKASFDHMHDTFDKRANNAIILMSDGANEDSTSISLQKLVAHLKKENKGAEQVHIFTAGLGPDADYDALKQIGLASGGYYYRIDTAKEGQDALLDGFRRNRQLGEKK